MDLYTAELVNKFIADLGEVQVPIMLFVCPDAAASEPPKINIDLTTETEDRFYASPKLNIHDLFFDLPELNKEDRSNGLKEVMFVDKDGKEHVTFRNINDWYDNRKSEEE